MLQLTREVSGGVVTIQTTHASANGAQPDITLVLDLNAVITDVRLSNAVAGEAVGDWVGRAWSDTVADAGGEKVRRMVSDARRDGVSAFRQVNQLFPSGLELPVEYTIVRVDGRRGLTAVGKSLQGVSDLQRRLIAAQNAMEQDYWKLREVETRYRLLFASTGAKSAVGDDAGPATVATLLDRLADAFVVVDSLGVVRRANRAFLDLAQAAADGAVQGESLGKWLAAPGADMSALVSHVLAHGAVRQFATTMRGDFGAETEVEISGVGDADATPTFFGFAIRDISRRPIAARRDGGRDVFATPAASNGNIPLRKIVDDVVGAVEKDYVLAALERTDGNRAAAAELLGMSRQSLYAKLNRYGLDGGPKRLPE
jgi:PAS domain-containing protein